MAPRWPATAAGQWRCQPVRQQLRVNAAAQLQRLLALTVIARRIRVTGIVQGVGFRPFVWRLAQELALTGWVRNDDDGVEIAAQGGAAQIAALLQRIQAEAPALARVDTLQAHEVAPAGLRCLQHRRQPACPAGVPAAPSAPTWRLPGLPGRTVRSARVAAGATPSSPARTAARATPSPVRLPYDRPQTSLAPFPLCPACEREYRSPADRRFHAETTCCPVCGPSLSLRDMQGAAIAGDAIAATLGLLRAGAIVAIKGLGGFHLACDARKARRWPACACARTARKSRSP